MPLNVNEVVNTQLNNTASGLSVGDFGKLALLTQDPGNGSTQLTADSYIEIASYKEAQTIWGDASVVAKAAQVFFAQSPKPKSLVVGFWTSTGTLTSSIAKFDDVYPNWYVLRPLPPTGQLADAEIIELTTAVAAYDKKKCSYTTNKAAHIEAGSTNPVQQAAALGNNNMWLTYDKNGQFYSDISAMARALSVNFSGNRTTITLKFKQEPNIVPNNSLTLTEANKCRALGINFYTYFGTFAMIAEGTVLGTSQRFWDELHGLDWFCNVVQTYVFNVIATSPTKIPQTDKGTARLVGAAEVACQQAVTNGFAAPGIWQGDEFGTLKAGDRLESGFYVYAPSVDEQVQADREARKAVVLQIALKLAGAIHSSDIIINFTR